MSRVIALASKGLSIAKKATHLWNWVLSRGAYCLGRGYWFRVSDLKLFWLERAETVPTLLEGATHEGLTEMQIGEQRFFWPQHLSGQALPWLYNECFVPFHKNPSSYAHPAMRLDERDWVLDGGAAEGFFSMYYAECAPKGGRLLAVEPLAALGPALRKTLRQFHDLDATVLPIVLGNSEGQTVLSFDPDNSCEARVVSTSDGPVGRGGGMASVETVRVRALDSVAAEWGLEHNGVVKLDVEGSEMSVLLGAREIMCSFKPALAVAVYHGLTNARLCAKIIHSANPSYRIEWRGFYGYANPPRPYMLFAY